MPRIEASSDAGRKLVDLEFDGERVELDKTVIEEFAGLLDHLLRDTVDRGIEREAERLSIGKPGRGRILVSARYEGAQAVIEVTDGRSDLRAPGLAEPAVRAGLCGPAEIASMAPS